jgi:hypothetical protein
MLRSSFMLVLLLGLLMCVSGCTEDADPPVTGAPPEDRAYTEEREPCADFNPVRNLYFGALHVHTSLSFDAWSWDIYSGPEDAYRFAKGEAIALPPLDGSGQGTRTVQLEHPLDFVAVTDHAEFFAEVEACVTAGSEAYDSSLCTLYREGTDEGMIAISAPLAMSNPVRSQVICGPDGIDCPAVAESVWKRVRDAAEGVYDRSSVCSFTAFAGYEYTELANNLHRNVIFRNENVPDLPVSYIDQPTPEGLWVELKRTCLDSVEDCDVLAIPHNSNLSSGKMFYAEVAGAESTQEEREIAALRSEMEPLVEIFQHKGDSECRNGLSGILGQPDELCGFEKLNEADVDDCGDGTGAFRVMGMGCLSRWDFVRNALLGGLREEERLGVNPYRLGMIGGTDTHNATPGAVVEEQFYGHVGRGEDTVEERLAPRGFNPKGIITNPGGLAAVWAEENSRDAIFDAMQRREVYGTSGPRITVRLFGGWEFSNTLCQEPDFVEVGYEQGVPMGGDLPVQPAAATAPRFAVLAMREPDLAARPGTDLQRIQIVKGWMTSDQELSQKVYDVAGDPDNGAGVDLQTCKTTGEGADTLCAVWTDPEFDPTQRTFYYARVVENPTCRWSTFQCLGVAPEERPDTCSDPSIAKTIQERAWSSPIWYTP